MISLSFAKQKLWKMNNQNPILITNNLTYSFKKKKKVINDLNILVENGAIYGFLGPNGAGKTTTIRLLMGLLHAKGEIKLFSENFKFARNEILNKVGAMIEEPSLYNHLTARQNLTICCKLINIDKSRIDEVLNIVKLKKDENTKIKHFSLGMKQRLSIAKALINRPELLILDEPTNGLDPQGIIEIRELILRLNQNYGITFFISSHLLSEVEKLCSHVGIIKNGELIFQGMIKDLTKKKSCKQFLTIKTDDMEKTLSLLDNCNVKKLNGNQISVPVENNKMIAAINKKLVDNSIDVYQLKTKEENLEDIFIQLTY